MPYVCERRKRSLVVTVDAGKGQFGQGGLALANFDTVAVGIAGVAARLTILVLCTLLIDDSLSGWRVLADEPHLPGIAVANAAYTAPAFLSSPL